MIGKAGGCLRNLFNVLCNSRFTELDIFFVYAAVALCLVAMFIQRTTSTTCQSPCNGSSDGLLGDRAILTKSNRLVRKSPFSVSFIMWSNSNLVVAC